MSIPGAVYTLVEQAHAGQIDAFGLPFVDHLCRVAAAMVGASEEAVQAALLHDAVEKGTASWEDLRHAGIGEEVIRLVDLLTQRPGESDGEYLRRCAADPTAARIKDADLRDMLAPERLARLDPAALRAHEERVAQHLLLLECVADLDVTGH